MRVWHLVAARTGTGKALEPAADALVVELSRAGGVLSVYPELSPSVNVPNWPTKGSMPPPRPPMNAPRLPLCASGVEARVAARGEAVSLLTVEAGAAPGGSTPPSCANAWRLLTRGAGATSSSFGPGAPCASSGASGPNAARERGEAAAKPPSPPRKWPLPLLACPVASTSPSRAFWLEEAAVGEGPNRGTAPLLPAPGLPPAPGPRPVTALGLPVRSSSPTPAAVRPKRSELRTREPLGLRLWCSPPTAPSGLANTPGVDPLGA